MGSSGLEPPTSRLSGVRSNRLSYEPRRKILRIYLFKYSFFKSGGHLFSHIVSNIVPSAGQVLTVVFGMRTGVTPDRIATGSCAIAMSKSDRNDSMCGALAHLNSESFERVRRMPHQRTSFARELLAPQSLNTNASTYLLFLRKEVIQPHLPIRLPCYDFTPVISPAFDGSFLAVRSPASGITNSHGVTGGVYKTRERIHRDILIRDY